MSLDVYLMAKRPQTIYSRNITHNLGTMAEAAGLYMALWRPEEIGISTADKMIPVLEAGLKNMIDNPAKLKELNPKNGWGDYGGLLDFVVEYLAACRENPDAIVRASR